MMLHWSYTYLNLNYPKFFFLLFWKYVDYHRTIYIDLGLNTMSSLERVIK